MTFLITLFLSFAGATSFGDHHMFVVQLDQQIGVSDWVPRLERIAALDRETFWTSRARLFKPGQSIVAAVAPAIAAQLGTNVPSGRTHVDLVLVGHGSRRIIGGETENHERLGAVADALVTALGHAREGVTVRLFVDVCYAGALWNEFKARAAHLPVNVRAFLSTSDSSPSEIEGFGRPMDRTVDVISAVRARGRAAGDTLDDEMVGVATLVGAFADERLRVHRMEARSLRGEIDDQRVIEALTSLVAERIFAAAPRARGGESARAQRHLETAVNDDANVRLRRGLEQMTGPLTDVAELLRLRASFEDDKPGDRESLNRLMEHPNEPLRRDAVDVFLIYAAEIFGFETVLEAYWAERHHPQASLSILGLLNAEIMKLFDEDDQPARATRDDFSKLCESALLSI